MFSKNEIGKLAQYKTLALAVSGGADSMALLYWFVDNRQRLADNFFVINIEHGIRGETSVADSQFVRDFCAKNNVECVVECVDVPAFCSAHGVGHEQGARMLRHDIFKKLVIDKRAERVVLAHHQNDQAESILMHIFRGSGIKGLVGMQKDNGHILRPFLGVTRKEIEEYVRINEVPYVTDESNFDLQFTRNFVRNEILPQVEVKYPNVLQSLQRLSSNAAEIIDFNNQFLSKQVDRNSDGSISIKIAALITHPALTKANLLKCFEALGVFFDIEERHLSSLISLIDMPNGSSLDMPFDIVVCKEYDDLVFAKRAQTSAFSHKFLGKNTILPDGSTVEVSDAVAVVFEEGVLSYDGDKIPKDCQVRTMQMGDMFKKYNGKTKKLCDYLTDIKMPKRLRHNLVLLATGQTVLAVLGCEISDEIKVDEFTKNIKKIVLRRKY